MIDEMKAIKAEAEKIMQKHHDADEAAACTLAHCQEVARQSKKRMELDRKGIRK